MIAKRCPACGKVYQLSEVVSLWEQQGQRAQFISAGIDPDTKVPYEAYWLLLVDCPSADCIRTTFTVTVMA